MAYKSCRTPARRDALRHVHQILSTNNDVTSVYEIANRTKTSDLSIKTDQTVEYHRQFSIGTALASRCPAYGPNTHRLQWQDPVLPRRDCNWHIKQRNWLLDRGAQGYPADFPFVSITGTRSTFIVATCQSCEIKLLWRIGLATRRHRH